MCKIIIQPSRKALAGRLADANPKWKGYSMKNMKNSLVLVLSLAIMLSNQIDAVPKIGVPKIVSTKVAKASDFFWNKGVHCLEPQYQCFIYCVNSVWWNIKAFNNFTLFAKTYDQAAGISAAKKNKVSTPGCSVKQPVQSTSSIKKWFDLVWNDVQPLHSKKGLK